MPQFMSLGFTFNGIASADVGYYIVNMDSSGTNALGLSKSIEEEDNNLSTKTFYGVKLDEFTFKIDIVKMPIHHTHYKILEITEEDINFLNRWLIQPREYKIFSSDQNRDIFYYAMFTDMNETRIGSYSYITLSMRLNAGFAYSSTIHHPLSIGSYYDLSIETKSNVDDYIYPDIELFVDSVNLIPNRPLPNNHDGWWVAYNNTQSYFWEYYDVLGLANPTVGNNESYVFSPKLYLECNTTYTFSIEIMLEHNVRSMDVYVLGYAEDGVLNFGKLLVHSTENNGTYNKHTISFVSAQQEQNIDYYVIRIDNNGAFSSVGGFVCFFDKMMLYKGDYTHVDMQYSEHIIIRNETLGEEMVLKNLTNGTHLICYNEDMKHIDCINNPSMNMRNCFNGQWFRLLGNSVNDITVIGFFGDIDIYFQNKIAVQH